MKKILERVNHHFIKVGKYSFSPIMEVTATLALEYCEEVKKGATDSPLFFCFPDKQAASLWLSIALLNNFFYEDHIQNYTEGINLSKGDRVRIFNTIAEIEKIVDNKVVLKFKDQGGFKINPKLNTQISKVSKSRKLNNWKLYRQRSKEVKSERNVISEILEPADSIIVNEHKLKSKVLIITGRGNSIHLKSHLHNYKIYNEPLNKIYGEDQNLLIRPDLENYKDVFSSIKRQEIESFITYLQRLEDSTGITSIKEEIKKLIHLFKVNESISIQFDNLFQEFVDTFEEQEPRILFLKTKYPGLTEELLENLRAVVINDLTQLIDFPNTILEFINRKIPIIFLSNRKIQNSAEFNFYERLFKSHPNYLRINWNKSKIKYLAHHTGESSTDFIDQDLWQQCLRFLHQQIVISKCPSVELDGVISSLQKVIGEMEGMENLQKKFYRDLYPALYTLKNSKSSSDFVCDQISSFKEAYMQVIPFGIEDSSKGEIEKAIVLAEEFKINSKHWDNNKNIFSILIPSQDGEKRFIPSEAKRINLPTNEDIEIIFSGYPYLEYSNKYLFNAVCTYFIPKIEIICWPNEAILTRNYLYRRIKAGYFTEKIFNSWISEDYILNEVKIEEEIASFLPPDYPSENMDDEKSLQDINRLKYKGYTSTSSNSQLILVKCDIINFDNGTFMFLPKNGKLLAEIETESGDTRIKNSTFTELIVGLRIFKYERNRSAYREISKQNQELHSAFEELDKWKTALENLFFEAEENLAKLENELKINASKLQISEASPTKSNIENWLFDEEYLCPRLPNLRLIMLSKDASMSEPEIEKIYKAYSQVLAYTISLSSLIKKEILRQKKNLKDDFHVFFEGQRIKVESRTIVSLEKSEIEVDYANTRKILC